MVGNHAGLLDVVEPAHELRRLGVERSGKTHHDGNSRVPLALLDLGQVRRADAGARGEVYLAHLASAPQLANPRSERTADARVPVVGHARIVRTRSLEHLTAPGASALVAHSPTGGRMTQTIIDTGGTYLVLRVA